MTKAQQVLVFYLVGGENSPVMLAVSEQKADELSARLFDFVTAGGIQMIEMADGRQVVVNFDHVACAMIHNLPWEVARQLGIPGKPWI